MSNELAKTEGFRTGLAKIQDTFAPMIENALTGNGINMDGYQKMCVMNAIAGINAVLETQGLSFNDQNFDRNNVTDILLKVASLKLNATATPREVYFQIRNSKRKVPGEKDTWMKQIEMGIEGDGNDALLANFGRDVETIHQYWLVREHDHFEYPTFRGIEFTPPVWTPTGKGKVVRVVYPITKKNGITEYFIAEREDVIKNLIAHIKNNLMNETFGIAKDRYNAKPEERKQIEAKKNEILKRLDNVTLDEALADTELANYISPAWKDPQSSEAMVIRKMRNNIVKKIPKDFGNAFVTLIAHETPETEEVRVRKEIYDNANTELIDFPSEQVESKIEPIEEKTPTKKQSKPNVEVQEGEIVDIYEKEQQETLFLDPNDDGPSF